MIHINTVNINVQMPSDEAGPTSALGDALLHAMAESLFAQQESDEEMESEGVAQPPIDPPRMNSHQRQASQKSRPPSKQASQLQARAWYAKTDSPSANA